MIVGMLKAYRKRKHVFVEVMSHLARHTVCVTLSLDVDDGGCTLEGDYCPGPYHLMYQSVPLDVFVCMYKIPGLSTMCAIFTFSTRGRC